MKHEALVIGGSFAGLSAATYIARARRSVCVIDAGQPRNRFAPHSHGVLTRDGSAPDTLLATARMQVADYPTVSFVDGTATTATREADGFTVTLATGDTVSGSRLVLAYGISDDLPDIPGLAERWGKSALHCPYCHGFEFSDKRLGVLNLSPMSIHQSVLISEWGPTTLFLNGAAIGKEEAGALAERGVVLCDARVKALLGEAASLSAIELENGRRVELDALYIGAPTRLNSDIAQQLGCELDQGPFGPIVRTDANRMTSVTGVFAAGDIIRGAHSVTWASADGVTAGTAVHRSLVF